MPGPSEAEFLRQILQLARLRGWRVAHFRAAGTAAGWRTPCQADAAGFPDLVLCRGKRLLWVEVKTDGGRLRGEQTLWLRALQAAGQTAIVWQPSMCKEIEAALL